MKTKKLNKLLTLNKQTIADLGAYEQAQVKGAARPSPSMPDEWSCNIPTQCVPAAVTECGLNCPTHEGWTCWMPTMCIPALATECSPDCW